MYSKKEFARELKKEIRKDFSVQKIAQWAHMLGIDRYQDISPSLDNIIQIVAVMDAGPEFELSEYELTLLANQLENEEELP